MVATIYIFKGGSHIVYFQVGRGRKMMISNQKTGFRYVDLDVVLDAQTAEKLRKHVSVMSDEQFGAYIEAEFRQMGYALVKKEEVSDGGVG